MNPDNTEFRKRGKNTSRFSPRTSAEEEGSFAGTQLVLVECGGGQNGGARLVFPALIHVESVS